MKNIFVFDLDNTLGWKTPLFPHVTRTNIDYLRKLSSDKENLLLFATGRPRSLVRLAMRYGALKPTEIYHVFPLGGVYEDGLYVESADRKIIYNAISEAPALFKEIKASFFDKNAECFFYSRGFALFPRIILMQEKTGSLSPKDYGGRTIKREIKLPKCLIPLWQQDNDVKETYKTPIGYKGDNLNALEPIFKEVYECTVDHLNRRFASWKQVGKLERWKDAIDFYPRLDDNEDVFRKEEGVEKLLSRVNVPQNTKFFVCCDTRNDIRLVDYIANKYPNYHVVCPSNATQDLVEKLKNEGYNHTILEQDCTRFAEGLSRLLS